MTVIAVSAARAKGVRVDESAAREHIKMMEGQWTTMQELMLQRVDPGGRMDQPIYSLLAMSAERYPANSITDSLVSYIAGVQNRDGAWHLQGISRTPIEEGTIARTALALHTLQLYGIPARKAEFEKRIARGRDWILEAKPMTNDDLAMRLTALGWTGVGREQMKSAGQALLATQRSDGGWAQNRNLSSDAFATGESLWALRETGVLSAGDSLYRRGVQYLLNTRWPDGSWYVRSRAVKFQPYFQSGFPFDHDQWISATATGWAVMGLAAGL